MGCSVESVLAGTPRTVVSVDGVVIPHDAISREAQNHPAATPAAAWMAAARALAVRELLLQAARRCALRPAPIGDGGRTETEEEALVRQLIEAEVVTPSADESSCRRYYDNNRARFRSPDRWQAAHILIAARRGDPAAFERARSRAGALARQLQDAPERFAELAASHSDCPSAGDGGNLGRLEPGSTTPAFEKALRGLAPGEITAVPVETAYGLHIIRLDRLLGGSELPFEVVRERIAGYLVERARHVAIAQFIARLAARAQITGVDLPTPAERRTS